MRVCPNCGYENDDTSDICIHCNQALPPDAASITPPEPPDLTPESTPSPEELIPLPSEATAGAAPPTPTPLQAQQGQSQDTGQKERQYLQGLGFGLIPVAVFLILSGIANGSRDEGTALNVLFLAAVLGVLLYLAEIITMIVFLTNARRRSIGYGLLTAVLVTPVAGYLGCLVILNSGA